MSESTRKYVVDTSAIVDGRIYTMALGELRGSEIIVPAAALAELEYQANQGRETGYKGLEILAELKKLDREGLIRLRIEGRRPTLEEVKLAPGGEIDSMIRELARELEATLITADRVQARVAEILGINVIYLEPELRITKEELRLLEFFTEDTMSVHLKEGAVPLAKRGKPGSFRLVRLSEEPMSRDELEEIAKEIIEVAKRDPEGFIEIERPGATVVQLGALRIVIARPPFSDGLEITAVRPVVKVTLDDYKLSAKLKRRLEERAEGILVCGPPGAGKSTFVQALAEFYRSKGKIVKTMESPRDLQLSPEITQYAPLDGSMENTADILLLVRPDYTIYDELRKTKDFEIYTDMRLAGVGMVGVVHATRPIDAIQRFIGRVELGMIPQVVDTVIYIKDGQIRKVYELALTVKVPTGMVEADLARPVVEVRDFETGEVEYEIYTFGEEVVVMPLKAERTPELEELEDLVYRELERRVPVDEVEVLALSPTSVVIYAPEYLIPKLIGRKGRIVGSIERKLGIRIDVRPKLEHRAGGRSSQARLIPITEIKEDKRSFKLYIGRDFAGKNISVYLDGRKIFSGSVSRSGYIRIGKNTNIGREIERALEEGRELTFSPE